MSWVSDYWKGKIHTTKCYNPYNSALVSKERVQQKCLLKSVCYAVCDDTQNHNKNKSETFLWFQIFLIRIQYFFLYQIFLIPNLKPSKQLKKLETQKFLNRSVTQNTQNLNETEPKTFYDTNFFLNRIR